MYNDPTIINAIRATESLILVDENMEQSVENNDDRIKLINRMEREMKAAAARLDFERAAQLRDRIYQLENPTN